MDPLERIKEFVESNPVALFIKGTPQMPMCGFSARSVEALMDCDEKFAYIDILADPDIRANLPKYADWPTFPQLYIKGELIGGCDIITELHENGELQTMIKEAVTE